MGAMAAMTLLRTEGLSKAFEGLKAVDAVDFILTMGETHAVIGPNGAGKTTFVSLLSGRLVPDAGRIVFDGRDITALPAHARVRLGIAYTFQITRVFGALTLRENVEIAAQRHARGRELADEVSSILSRVGVSDIADEVAGAQSYGHQRLLEVAMGLALRPRLLILDEPTQGLSAGEIERFVQLVRDLPGDVTILLIEHNMDVVMALAERITVLDHGAVLAEGAPAEIRSDPAVQAAYLGA